MRSSRRSARRSSSRDLAREDAGRARGATAQHDEHLSAGDHLPGAARVDTSCRRGRTRSTEQSRPQYSTISTRASIAFPPAPPGSTSSGRSATVTGPGAIACCAVPSERDPGAAAARHALSVDPLGVQVEDVAVAHEVARLRDWPGARRALRGADLLRLRPRAARRSGRRATERLLLVVGHVDRRAAELLVDAPDLGAHLEPELGVEVGQRLVHQHERRLDHDGARDGDALLLAARELPRQLVARAPAAARGRARRRPWRAISASARRRIARPKAMFFRTLMCGKSA